MKDILSDFVKGTSTEKLSILSNVSTILGVSVATFVAGPFLSKFTEHQFVVSDFIIAIVFYFLALWFLCSVMYDFFLSFYKNVKNKKIEASVMDVVQCLFILWLSVVAFPYVKYYTGNIFNVSYLLPMKAKVVINDVNNEVIDNGQFITIRGKANLIDVANGSDYEVVLYLKNKAGIYKGESFNNGDYTFQLSKDGRYTLPVSISKEALFDSRLVFYRGSDWSALNTSGGDFGFPNSIMQFPDSEMENLGAFVHKIKT
ncbi:hypothetical protein AB6D11_26980 [Vibrio splendidus]